MSNITYDSTLYGGLKIAEHADAVLALIDEAATLKELVGSLTKQANSTTPAAGDIKEMLEKSYASSVIELSMSGQTGNIAVGDTLLGGTSGATGTLVAQDDTGSVSHLVVLKVSGTFQDGEAITVSGGVNDGNNGTIGSLVLAPGGGDGKYPGEVALGVDAGSGADFYDAVVAAADALTALRDEYVQIWQGG